MTLLKKYAFYGSAVVASLALALVLLVSSAPRTAHAAALAAFTVTPAAAAGGAVTTVAVTATNAAALAGGQTIQITFPAGFGFNSPAATALTASTGFTTTATTGFTTSTSGQVVTITLASGNTWPAATAATFTLSNVTVPTAGVAVAATAYSIQTSTDQTFASTAAAYTPAAFAAANTALLMTNNGANGTGTFTNLQSAIGFNGGTNSIGTGALVLQAPTGTEWDTSTIPSVTVTGAVVAGAATVSSTGITVNITTGGATAADSILIGSVTRPKIRVQTNSSTTAATAINITEATGGAAIGGIVANTTALATVTPATPLVAPYTLTLVMVSTTTACGTTNPVAAINSPVAAADGSGGQALCAQLRDANGVVVSATPIAFSVSLGVVSTGTSKTVTAFTNSAGNATTNYRGGGGVLATDTAVASAPSPTQAVGTLAISNTAPAGTTAAKVVVTPPTVLAVAAQVTNTNPNYQSPTIGTNFSVQAQDGNGLGVNGQVLLVSVDRGALVAGFAGACAGATTKSLTVTSASGALTAGGTATSGVGQLTYCSNQLDAPGKATITVSNVSTSMANATGSVSMAGRPAKVTAVATGNAIAATVVDAGGNAVADGTPVRFTISANAGAVSTGCTTTTNGQASSVVALIAATGTVIVSSDWNETAAASTCVAAGAQQIAASVSVPGGTSSASTPTTTPTTPAPAAGTGAFAATPVFSASKLANAVFTGTLSDAVLTAAGATGAWAQDSKGVFNLYVVGAPAFVNAGFLAAFPNNAFTTATALTLVGK